ncbi:hypothetical protein CK203_065307 [Vitis vinifera]|uniref:Uncharacterized protein n=1 Tax=Vitis vinifera TaxID=29760 RepID=A0A438FNQ7_VITVI|nr:hypothetical protein CK203_065307 [Vitis vinifera]
MAEKKTVSSSRASEVRGKAIDKLDAKEFRERFCIPNNVAIELLNGRVLVSSEKTEEKTIIFSKEQFNAGLRFPLPALFKEFLHFTKIPPVFIHPNIVRVKNDIFSMSAHLPSLQLVTELPDSTKGGATGHVVVRGAWAGLLEHPARPFSPNYSLVVPGPELRGPPCGLGGKGVFWLSQQIVRDRRQGEAVQDAADRAEPDGGRPGAPRICHQHSPQEDAKGGSGEEEERRDPSEGSRDKNVKQTPPPKKTPAKRRKLVKKNGKDVREPTPPMEFAPPPIIHEAEVMIEEPVNAAPHSISSGSGHLAGLNHSSTSLAAVAPLANLAEEAASVNHPDSRNLDADAAEAVCAAPMEEVGVESQSQPSDDPDRLALVLVTGPPSKKPRSGAQSEVRTPRAASRQRQQEIEVSCSSAHDAHPEGGEVEMVTETPAVPVVVSAEVAPGDVHPAGNVEVPNPEQESSSLASSEGDPVNDASCTSASPFSYAELEEKLKQIPPGLPLVKPSAQMFEMVETLVSGLRGMANQYDLFTDLLRTTDYPAYPPPGGENEALWADLADAKGREESMQARLREASDEMAGLRGEELEWEFAAEREEIEAEYQKQVDDTFIFGYRCCMKKNGIKRDVPSIPPGEEKKLHDTPAP